MKTPDRAAAEKRAKSTSRYEQGILTMRHGGQQISLGRYATREHAARAAAVYFATHPRQD